MADRLIGRSALQAFQSDVPAGGIEPTREDQAAVLVATMLRQSLAAEDDVASTRVRSEALAAARETVGGVALEAGCTYDDFPARSSTDVIRVLAQRTDHAGRTHLAEHLLESAAAIETDPIDAGRIRWDRSRMARKLGQLDLSYEQNQQLLRDARRLKSPELLAKAHYGLAAIAETRGNFVDTRAHIRRVIRVAKSARLKNLLAGGYSGLGTTESFAQNYGEAVANYWKAHQLVNGRGQIARAVLGNLAQTLLVSGRPAEARKIAVTLLQSCPPMITALPVIGTFAVATAQLQDSKAVRWAVEQLRLMEARKPNHRDLAEAMLECAAALRFIGEPAEASTLWQRAEDIAHRHGLHALTFDEAMRSVQILRAPQPFHGAAAEAAAAIVELDAPSIPTLFAAVPA